MLRIHNHTDSHCFVKVLQGQLLETRYACPKEGDEAGAPLVEIGIDIHPTNAITYINGKSKFIKNYQFCKFWER